MDDQSLGIRLRPRRAVRWGPVGDVDAAALRDLAGARDTRTA